MVCAPLRTSVGRYGGALLDVPVQTLGATVVQSLLETTGLGRLVALDAGLPVTVPGM
ncbi:hypothetical protein [Mumia sp. ZJ430]|uniref:hypothetical protein n=1 Tax=Mumia sp. ZJ430 TaxID=2708083 RepID=UPI00142017BF|nr:hypothetical protein [Mumia sp. ZJ430]